LFLDNYDQQATFDLDLTVLSPPMSHCITGPGITGPGLVQNREILLSIDVLLLDMTTFKPNDTVLVFDFVV
jgi:hypothetical protein